MSETFDITYLPPADIQFFYSDGGMLQLRTNGEVIKSLTLHRTFPFAKPYEYISIWDGDTEIGVIKNIGELDEQSQTALKQELHYRYVIPTVTKVLSIKEEPGLWTFKLETDRGNLKLMMRNIHEHLSVLPSNRIIITDMDGKRCEIRSMKSLDLNSRKELAKVI
ncbi:DUF1854 domain-containing protein [Sutcliffiella rhizosphaerae]|uniref:DUF1854 domain-containing protein n=1 Tax=Sutcliffiella rhizosphaerae TaxID=2880967 RepID=A0ABM8YLU9_9BACI|nr:DUF1854 domain-containing protein [Sutcliffiella rhizosphaerae]CAG9620781.1 hypothetical protein BACCIP111883_01552 [Sutcliffiella rhizosphaerae]